MSKRAWPPSNSERRYGPVPWHRRRRDGAGGQGAGPRPHRPRFGVHRSAHGRRVIQSAGTGQSPAIDAVMALVGKERVLARIDRALAYIEARMAAE
ncbi:hypothetical protein SJS79_06115 [Aeromonas caviae]|nr:hypothetical protein [Aeromonas caviae]MDX7946722.1 hypothetical protein [Aeromonas caviae]